MARAENVVTREILFALGLRAGQSLLLVRVQSGAHKVGSYFVRGAEPGTADLIGSYRGVGLAIEVKTPRGKQNPNQKAWEERWSRAGGVYALCRSASDALAVIDSIDRRIDGSNPSKLH
jgi:hypothetical protein